MESPHEVRGTTVSAAVSATERDAIYLAVRIDKLGSVSEALRSRTVTDLVARGLELEKKLASLAASEDS